jgi:hypothetical protein
MLSKSRASFPSVSPAQLAELGLELADGSRPAQDEDLADRAGC